MRPSKKELQDCIHKPKAKEGIVGFERSHEYYNNLGEVIVTSSKEQEPVAQKIILGIGIDYKVLINLQNQVYRPFDKNYLQSSTLMSQSTSKPAFRFAAVSKEVFDNYITFLKTKKVGFAEKAERYL